MRAGSKEERREFVLCLRKKKEKSAPVSTDADAAAVVASEV